MRNVDIADYFSFFNVLFGFLAIIFNEPRYIFASALMDGIDGYLARKGYSGKYGRYMDSLADFTSFGVATSFFIPFYSLAYLFAGMFRLARFTAEKTEYFIGFPITSSSLLVISLLMISGELYAGILSLILAFFMISELKYKKVRNRLPLLISAIVIGGALVNETFAYLVFLLNFIYLISPFFGEKLSKYF
uniref:CDP-diacylglycerol--serine O-phosphatidyltransferase n=1 Tax=Geoglobus ahangari TaxID=113653 RepID=A0A7C4S5F9_9EURY